MRLAFVPSFLLLVIGCTDPILLTSDSGPGDGSTDSRIDAPPADGGGDGGDAGDGGMGCPTCVSFGTAHIPIEVLAASAVPGTASSHFAPELSDDGQSLFFTRFDDSEASGELYVARRAFDGTRFDEFGASMPVSFAPLPGRPFRRATITGNTLDVFVEIEETDGEPRIYTASRTGPFASFGALEEVEAFRGAPTRRPSVSRDGLQLVVQGASGLLLARRATRTDPFTTAEPVDVPPPAEEPRLSVDGLTLTYRNGPAHYELTRTSVDDPFSTAPERSRFDSILGTDGALPFHDPQTAELWYTLEWPRYWEIPSLGAVLMRVRTCAGDRPCPNDGLISCELDEVPTADGLHCFSLVTPPAPGADMDWQEANAAACIAVGRIAASIHTPGETATVRMLLSGAGVPLAYLGLRKTGTWWWARGERYFGAPWAPPPEPSDIAALVDAIEGTWQPVDGTAEHPGVCERDVWPRWPVP